MNELKNHNLFCIQRISSHLVSMMKQNGALDPQLLFISVWERFKDDYELKFSSDQMKGWKFKEFQLNFKERLHLLIVEIMRNSLGLDYRPKLEVQGDYFKFAIKANTSSMFISVHDGFAFPATILFNLGQRSSLITAHPKVGDLLWRTGLRPDLIDLVTCDIRSLVKTRTLTLKGVISANYVDYKNPKNDVIERLINPSLFRFAIKEKFSIYFVKSEVEDNGSISILTELLKTTQDPIEDAKLFIKFQRSEYYNTSRTFSLKN